MHPAASIIRRKTPKNQEMLDEQTTGVNHNLTICVNETKLRESIRGNLAFFGSAPNLALHQSTTASSWWCGPRPRLGWVEMAVGLPEGPSYLGHSPSFFRYAAP